LSPVLVPNIENAIRGIISKKELMSQRTSDAYQFQMQLPKRSIDGLLDAFFTTLYYSEIHRYDLFLSRLLIYPSNESFVWIDIVIDRMKSAEDNKSAG
jgi:hypothetical protein